MPQSGTIYAVARMQLQAFGYQAEPQTTSGCTGGEGTSKAPEGACFPELDSCVGSSDGNCVYIWRKGRQFYRVVTRNDPPLFDSIVPMPPPEPARSAPITAATAPFFWTVTKQKVVGNGPMFCEALARGRNAPAGGDYSIRFRRTARSPLLLNVTY